MITDKDWVCIFHGPQHLQEILAGSGLTPADLQAMLNSELECDLPCYLDARLSNRMNCSEGTPLLG